MASIQLTWTLPVVGERQRPLSRVLVQISAEPEESGWTDHKLIAADAKQELTIVDAHPGEHYFRLIVIDADGQRSAPVVVSVSVPYLGPSPVLDAIATVV